MDACLQPKIGVNYPTSFDFLFLEGDGRNILSSSTDPKTWTMTISADFANSRKLENRALLHIKDYHNFVKFLLL